MRFSLKSGDVVINKNKDGHIRCIYKIHKKISEGGSAITYIATTDDKSTFVCIKELYPHILERNILRNENSISFIDSLRFSTDDAKTLYLKYKDIFGNEENILDKLQKNDENNHYGFLHQHTSFEYKGFLYQVYETAESITLLDYMENELPKLTNDEQYLECCVNIIIKVLDCLENIHKKNILHLDVSPSNILIMKDNQDTIRIIDFASAFDLKTSNKKEFIYSSTQGYSALELIEFSKNQKTFVDNLSFATDLYSVAAILFKLLIKREPTATDFFGAWKTTLSENLKTPSPHEYNIHEELCKIIEKGLNSDMHKRYQTVAEMREDIIELKRKIIKSDEVIKKEKQRWLKRVVSVVSSIMGIILIVALTRFVMLPNRKTADAYKLIETGNAKAAYEELLEINDSYYSKPWLHFAYSEEKIKTLAWSIYNSRENETVVAFDDNVVQAVKTPEENIVAILESNEVSIKNMNMLDGEFVSFSIPNTNGLLSHNGKYYTTFVDDNNVSVFHISERSFSEIASFSNVKNFTYNEDFSRLLMIFDNKWIVYNVETNIVENEVDVVNDCVDYLSGRKTIDFNIEKDVIAYVNNKNGIDIKHINGEDINVKKKKELGFEPILIQISVEKEKSVLNIIGKGQGMLRSVEYDYFENIASDILTSYQYNYCVYAENQFGMSQAWTVGKGLTQKYICINDKNVSVKAIDTASTSHIRFIDIDDMATKEDLYGLVDYSDVNYPYYYDYDFNTKRFYVSNIEVNSQSELKSDIIFNGVPVKFSVYNNKYLCLITSKDKESENTVDIEIIFGKIDNDTILQTEKITVSGAAFDFSEDRQHLAYSDDKNVYLYILGDDGWRKTDEVLYEADGIYLLKFNSDSTTLLAEKSFYDKTSILQKYDISEKGVLSETESLNIGNNQIHYLSNDLIHGYGYTQTDNVIIHYDFSKEKTNAIKFKENDLKTNGGNSIAVGGELITLYLVQQNKNLPKYKILIENDTLSDDAYSNVVQHNSEEIVYVERISERDYLNIYNCNTEKITKIPLKDSIWGIPVMYSIDVCSDGYMTVTALYSYDAKRCMTVTDLYCDYSKSELFSKCETFFADV